MAPQDLFTSSIDPVHVLKTNTVDFARQWPPRRTQASRTARRCAGGSMIAIRRGGSERDENDRTGASLTRTGVDLGQDGRDLLGHAAASSSSENRTDPQRRDQCDNDIAAECRRACDDRSVLSRVGTSQYSALMRFQVRLAEFPIARRALRRAPTALHSVLPSSVRPTKGARSRVDRHAARTKSDARVASWTSIGSRRWNRADRSS